MYTNIDTYSTTGRCTHVYLLQPIMFIELVFYLLATHWVWLFGGCVCFESHAQCPASKMGITATIHLYVCGEGVPLL